MRWRGVRHEFRNHHVYVKWQCSQSLKEARRGWTNVFVFSEYSGNQYFYHIFQIPENEMTLISRLKELPIISIQWIKINSKLGVYFGISEHQGYKEQTVKYSTVAEIVQRPPIRVHNNSWRCQRHQIHSFSNIMRENRCILELYVQPKCQASMKIEQKPFKICNDSFFFLPDFFLKKLMRLFPNKMWGINPIKGKNKFQETITLGVRQKSYTYDGRWM